MPVIARNSTVDRAIAGESTREGGGGGVRAANGPRGARGKTVASTPPPDISSPGSYVCHEF